MAPQKRKEAKYEKLLRKIYYTPKEPGSFGGIQGLHNASGKKGKKVRCKQVVKWLSTQDTYTLHKPTRQNFPRAKVVVTGIDHQWQADLVDLSSLASRNKGVKYLLTCIDVFSKYAWVEPLKSKTGQALITSFEHIFKNHRKPLYLQTDQGKEFVNQAFQQYLKKKKVHFFTTYNEEMKASIVERFNRTLKTKMWKYFTRNNTKSYLEVLDDIVWSYNHSYHRSIKMTPMEVNAQNQEDVWHHLYRDEHLSYKCPKFQVGDHVKISKFRKAFKKGYLPNWTEEMFTIHNIKRSVPTQYHIKDESGVKLKGSFYEHELQKVVKRDSVYRIEAILDKRQKNNRIQVLVKWAGYPSSFNSWINQRDL